MRPFLLIIIATFASLMAEAKCSVGGIYPVTKSGTLNKNGIVILEFYAYSQRLIQELNKKYPIYLHSENGKVALAVHEILNGEFQATQVVFKPVSELTINQTYIVVIDSLPWHDQPLIYNAVTKKLESVKFTISNSVDTEQPILEGPIKVGKKTLVEYGCGPARWVYFSIAGQDQSELFVRANVKNQLTGKTTTYIIPLEKDGVRIGHDMCSGGFYFEKGNNYEVTFSMMDQSGNTSLTTDAIPFRRPTIETEEE